jgi:hypothetical protein
MFAVTKGHAAVMAWLLGEGGATGTLEARDEDGHTPFLCACNIGQLECAQALAAAGCDVAAAGSEGDTALTRAVVEGHAAVVAWLLGEGGAAGTLEALDENGVTAFLRACGGARGGQLECAQALAAAGCDMAVVNSEGDTALMRAASNGRTAVVAWLLRWGRAGHGGRWRRGTRTATRPSSAPASGGSWSALRQWRRRDATWWRRAARAAQR